MKTGILSRAAVSQTGSSSGSSSLQPGAVGLPGRQAEALHDLADADRAGLDVGLELRGDLRAGARTDAAEVERREDHHAVLVPAGPHRVERRLSRSPDAPLALTITCRLSGSIAVADGVDDLGGGERRRVAVDVDDRKLRARHRMLRHDQRRPRLVLADARRRKLRLATLGRPRPDLPGRSCWAPADASAPAKTTPSSANARRISTTPVGEKVAASRKPNSVPFARRRGACAPPRLAQGNDHSSSPAIAGGIKRPTRRLYGRAVCRGRRRPPYLVLLRAGFCLPPVLPRARCALTAPFHPYLSPRPCGAHRRAVYFLCHCPSGCPDRALPGALPCGVRTFLPPSTLGSASARAASDGSSHLLRTTLDCQVRWRQVGRVASACGHTESRTGDPRRGISVSSRWGWSPSASSTS